MYTYPTVETEFPLNFHWISTAFVCVCVSGGGGGGGCMLVTYSYNEDASCFKPHLFVVTAMWNWKRSDVHITKPDIINYFFQSQWIYLLCFVLFFGYWYDKISEYNKQNFMVPRIFFILSLYCICVCVCVEGGGVVAC